MNVDIYLLDSSNDFDAAFSYLVPSSLANDIFQGQFVELPFGPKNSRRIGIVWKVFPTQNQKNVLIEGKEYEVKEIYGISGDYIPLTQDEMELCEKTAYSCICCIGDVVRCLRPVKKQPAKLVDFIKLNVSDLEAIGLVGGNQIKNISQINLIKALLENGSLSKNEITNALGIKPYHIKALKDKGYVSVEKRPQEIITEDEESGNLLSLEKDKELTEQQRVAFNKIISLIDKKEDKREILLHGVTASGKTEVYFHTARKVIEKGGKVIILVPEISLTPQMVTRFKARFGECASVLHSRLSDKERYSEWMRVYNNRVSVVIGPRSAVFAPFEKVDLIIIDEEHDPSYRSLEQHPLYDTAEIARLRAKQSDGVIIYGSATPKVATYYRALNGEIELAEMTKRANSMKMPDTVIADMKKEGVNSKSEIIGATLYNAIKANIESNNQAIIFVQRRGYSKRIVCKSCGKTIVCKKCRVAMTYHEKVNRLICHYCGNTGIAPAECPVCKSKNLDSRGAGTERVEKELLSLFPGTSSVRMDSDTTSGKNGHEKVLKTFADSHADFLVGTQMIAKGHDFPDVTLVGVISADSLIAMQEYDASERAFDLLNQVSGRAGRAEKEGRVVIQSYNTEDYAIKNAAENDYKKFYENEIATREILSYPPFCSMAFIEASFKDDRKTYDFCLEIKEKLKNYINTDNIKAVEVFNPSRNPIARINNRYRWRIILKSTDRECLLSLCHRILPFISAKKKASLNGMLTDILLY